MSLNGWISLHRQMIEWEWYTDANTCRVFLHCLLKANHTEKTWRGIAIKRGQFLSSYDSIASELKLTRQKVRTSIGKLKVTNEITIVSNPQSTMFTVVQYDKYQTATGEATNDQPTINQRITNKQPTDNQRVTTTNNDNNVNNDNKVNKVTKRFVKPDLKSVSAYMSERNCIDSDQQADKFLNYYDSNGWKVGRNPMKDWKAAVRNWLGNNKPIKSNGFHSGDKFDLSNDMSGLL